MKHLMTPQCSSHISIIYDTETARLRSDASKLLQRHWNAAGMSTHCMQAVMSCAAPDLRTVPCQAQRDFWHVFRTNLPHGLLLTAVHGWEETWLRADASAVSHTTSQRCKNLEPEAICLSPRCVGAARRALRSALWAPGWEQRQEAVWEPAAWSARAGDTQREQPPRRGGPYTTTTGKCGTMTEISQGSSKRKQRQTP